MTRPVPNDEFNWTQTGGMVSSRVRRFPTFIVEQTEKGTFRAYDELEKYAPNTPKMWSPTIEGLAKMMAPYCRHRTGGGVYE